MLQCATLRLLTMKPRNWYLDTNAGWLALRLTKTPIRPRLVRRVLKNRIIQNKTGQRDIEIYHGVSVKSLLFTNNGNIIVSDMSDQLVLNEIFNTTNQIKNIPIFTDRYLPIDYKLLTDRFCKAAKDTLIVDNAGGRSEISEALIILLSVLERLIFY